MKTATIDYVHTETTATFRVRAAPGKLLFATRSYRTDLTLRSGRSTDDATVGAE